MNDPNIVLNTLFSNSESELYENLAHTLTSSGFNDFTIWRTNGIICEPVQGIHKNIFGRFDIYDLGFEGMPFFSGDLNLEIFDEKVVIKNSIFFMCQTDVCGVLTLHSDIIPDIASSIAQQSIFFAKRIEELKHRDSNINVYVDYQKKIEFIKQGSAIFKAIEVDEVIATSLSFFMDVFAAEAGCSLYKDEFSGFGLERDDITGNIKINSDFAFDKIMTMTATEFMEDNFDSSKFNINNAFFVYEKNLDLRILLFNIHFDIVPDKEFSELVSSIVSIAVENALNHKEMTDFKVQESEMHATAEILSKFVTRELYKDGCPEIKGISYPAKSAGGDYLVIKEEDDRMFFCVADVCGKGYSAAVFTVLLSVFNDLRSFVDIDGISLAKLATEANKFLIEKGFDNRFITAFFGLYDKKYGTLCYVSCGHEPALLIKPDNSCKEIMSEYIPMGIMEEEYSSLCVKIEKGDALFVYTDGIIEYIEEEKLLDRIIYHSKNSDDVVNALYDELVTDKDSQKDDFTCMFMQF